VLKVTAELAGPFVSSYRPAPTLCGPSFSWEIMLLSCEEYMRWHFMSRSPAEHARKITDGHKHLLSEAVL